MEEFKFTLRKIFARCAVHRGLNINTERYKVKTIDEGAGNWLAQSILLLATKEEEVYDCPDNFLTRLGQKWHTLKKKLPRRFFPLGIKRVWAVSKFPDVNVPASFFGSEFVHFRVMADVEKPDEDEQA